MKVGEVGMNQYLWVMIWALVFLVVRIAWAKWHKSELENLSENEWNMIEQLHEAKYSKPTLAEWLAERDAQLCNIDIDGWKGHLPVPKEWTIDTVMSIIRNAAPKYED